MHRRPLKLETLEERRLLAIDFDWNPGPDILTILIDPSDSETNIVDIEENTNHVIVSTDAGLFSSGVVAPNIADLVDTIVIHGATVGSLIDVSNAELHNVLLFPDLEELIVRAGPGDDRIVLGPHGNLVLGVEIHGGSSGSGSDVLILDSTGGGAQNVTIEPDDSIPGQTNVVGFGPDDVEVVGIEVVLYEGDDFDGGDDLTVAMGAGTAVARVENTALGSTDVVTSNRLPAVEFDGVATFTLQGSSGGGEPTVATFATNDLEGADDYEFDSEGEDTLVIEGGDAENDDFTVTDPAVGNVAVTDENHSVTVTAFGLSADGDDRLQINTRGGDDSVTVDVDAASPSDLIDVPITFDGGAGADLLIVEGTPPGEDPVDEVLYRPGPHVTEGRLLYEDDEDNPLMTIDFVSLEPVVALVPAPTFTVDGTPADNAISYEQTPGDVTRGRVTVDAYELIDFSNKQHLVINGLAGSDLVNLNNPETPTALTGITVNGGDPTGSDTVIVNGTTAADTITMTYDLSLTPPPSSTTAPATDEARIVGAQPVPVEVDGAELLILNGQGGNDSLEVNTPDATDSTIVLTPGATVDSGQVQVDSLLPMRFTGLGATGSLTLTDPGGVETAGDTLVYNGTAASDTFTVPHGTLAAPSIALNGQIGVGTNAAADATGVENYRLRGLGGDDTFNIIPQADVAIRVEGDEPGASDVLNFARDDTGAATVIVELDSDPAGPSLIPAIEQPGFAAVTLSGIEWANIDGNTADLFAAGTRIDDVVTYMPLDTDAGVLTAQGISTVFTFDEVPQGTNTFTITGGSGGFADKVIFNGTSGSDLIRVDSPNRTVELDVLGFGFPPAVLATWRDVTLDDGTAAFGTAGIIEVVTVDGSDGNDTFHVVPAAPVGNGLYVNVQGGSPQASDALVITSLNVANDPVALPAEDFVVVGKSRVPNAGNVLVYQTAVRRPNIAYENVEVVSPNVAGGDNLLILGPDLYEENEFRQTAAMLGAADTIHVENLAIFPNANEHPGVPIDEDWFEVEARQTGTLDFQVFFRAFDVGLLPAGGDLDITVHDATGAVIAGTGAFGTVDADADERVRIPAVAGQTYFLRVFGANDAVINGYDLTILNEAPPVPYDLELKDAPVDGTTNPPGGAANSDTGRSQFDNITYDNTPTLFLRLDDGIFLHDLPGNPADDTPPDEVIPIPFQGAALAPGYRIALFDEGSTPPQVGTPPQTPLGFATATAQEGVYTFTTPVLSDGSHFLTARVQMIDPADPTQTGFGPRSASLEIIVDTGGPPVSFGDPAVATDGLHPDSDTGVAGLPATFVDRVTSDTTPTFWGRAEADAVIRVYLDAGPAGRDATDVFLGETVAVPLDGTNQFPGGYWELTSIVDMNDPAIAGLDGLRSILVEADDPAGNLSDTEALDIFLDTQGPRVTDVYLTDDPAFNLFNPKPSEGPTPPIESLSIDIEDLPDRVATFLYQALAPGIFPGDPATEPGHFLVRGDHNGVIRIQNIQFLPDPVVAGQPATGTIVITFFEPLPDDRFTLTISDELVDPAGNRLDGENNAVEPQDPPEFPSGDGQPGGDFVARFTVDSRAEIGLWAAGSVYVDTNGNFQFDPQNPDPANRDIVYTLGFTTDYVFAGNFVQAPGGTADGFDKLAIYGSTAAGFRWSVDVTNDGVPDLNVAEPAAVTGIPVAGNFDVANGQNGDEVGVFTGTTWRLDTNHDFRVDFQLTSRLRGFPMVGDFDGDGYDDLATLNSQKNRFEFDLTGGTFAGWDGTIDDTIVLPFGGFIGVRERPVAADMDADGIDDIGLWVPDRGGMTPRETGEWYFLISSDPDQEDRGPGNVNTLDHVFTPIPFGHDIFAQFGDEFGVPVVGNFDPPVTGGQQPVTGGNPAGGEGAVDVSQATGAPAPTIVSLAGTSGNDVFRLLPGPTPQSWIAEINGVRQQIDDNPVAVEFDGLGGNDKITVTSAGGGEMAAELWPGRVSFAGTGISFTAKNVETILVDGRGGGDGTARFHDSEGDDRFRATPDWARLWGEGFSNQVLGFLHVIAHATPGGIDVAQLFDSPGDDRFEATPEYVRLDGGAFDLQAEAFRYAYGYAQKGGNDTARLYDSEGDDRFRATPDWARLYGEGFYTRAVGFPTVYGYATSGGIDMAQLFDSPGDDRFEATPEYARLDGDGFVLQAEAFRYAYGYAQNGGNDMARLYDSEGDDRFRATPDWARLHGEGFYTRAVGFPTVYGYATSGGIDVAQLFDSPGNDHFEAAPEYARLYGNGFDVRVEAFRYAHGYARNGGNDTARLYDSALNDRLKARDGWARLFNDDAQLGFSIRAAGFKDVLASSRGEDDTQNVDPQVLDWLMTQGWR